MSVTVGTFLKSIQILPNQLEIFLEDFGCYVPLKNSFPFKSKKIAKIKINEEELWIDEELIHIEEYKKYPVLETKTVLVVNKSFFENS